MALTALAARRIKHVVVAPVLALSVLAPLQIPAYTHRTLPSLITYRRNMSGDAKTKSESEWRAVLSPEQASPIMHPHSQIGVGTT